MIQDNKKNRTRTYQVFTNTFTTMNKHATIIGINYIGTVSELSGCIKDSKDIKSLLETRYNFKNVVYLTDTEQTKPTDSNIRLSIAQLISHAQSTLESSDRADLVFYYSGHGASIPDRSGDETDRKDETVCPLDGGLIVDDDLLKLLIFPLRDLALANPTKTITLFTMFDSCHSGSILDLNHVYDMQLDRWKPFTRKPVSPIAKNLHLVSLSGCQDGEYSTDLGTQGGALTQTVLKVLQQKPLSTWKSLIFDVVTSLKPYKQKPLLTTLTPIDLDYAFLNIHNTASRDLEAPVIPKPVAISQPDADTTEPVRAIESNENTDRSFPLPTIQLIPPPQPQPEPEIEQQTQPFVIQVVESNPVLPSIATSVSDFTLTQTNNSSSTTKKTVSIYKLKFDPSTQFDAFSHVLKSNDFSTQLKLSLDNNNVLKIKYSKLVKN